MGDQPCLSATLGAITTIKISIDGYFSLTQSFCGSLVLPHTIPQFHNSLLDSVLLVSASLC